MQLNHRRCYFCIAFILTCNLEKPEEADEVIEYLKERFCRSNVEDSSSDIQLDELRVAAEIMPEMGEFIRHSLDGWLRSGKGFCIYFYE